MVLAKQPQPQLTHNEVEFRIVIQEAFIHHHLGDVLGPTFDVCTIAKQVAHYAPRLRL